MMSNGSLFLQAALALSLMGCNGTNASPEEQARRAADTYMESVSLLDAQREVTVQDDGDRWLVIYHRRKGWTGGDHKVWIDKRTMRVADRLFQQ